MADTPKEAEREPPARVWIPEYLAAEPIQKALEKCVIIHHENPHLIVLSRSSWEVLVNAIKGE